MYMKDWHMVYIGDLPKRAMAIPTKPGERFIFSTIYHPGGRAKMKIGKKYTIQEPMSRLAIFRIKITNIRKITAKRITDKIANTLGYRNTLHWREKWNSTYASDNPVKDNTELFLVDFVLE